MRKRRGKSVFVGGGGQCRLQLFPLPSPFSFLPELIPQIQSRIHFSPSLFQFPSSYSPSILLLHHLLLLFPLSIRDSSFSGAVSLGKFLPHSLLKFYKFPCIFSHSFVSSYSSPILTVNLYIHIYISVTIIFLLLL